MIFFEMIAEAKNNDTPIMLTQLTPFFYTELSKKAHQMARKHALLLYPDLKVQEYTKSCQSGNQYGAIFPTTRIYLDIELTAEQALIIGLQMAIVTRRLDIFSHLFPHISIPSSSRQTRPDGYSGVYLMYNSVTKLTKIGVTYDIDSRITELSNASGIQLQLLHYCFVDDAYSIEASLHRQYNQHRTVGEWFALDATQTQTIIAEISRLQIGNNAVK